MRILVTSCYRIHKISPAQDINQQLPLERKPQRGCITDHKFLSQSVLRNEHAVFYVLHYIYMIVSAKCFDHMIIIRLNPILLWITQILLLQLLF